MTEQIRVLPQSLRRAADAHRETAYYLATMPSSHAEIQQSLDSLGPIYGGLREAARDLLEERRRCYEHQAEAHAGMSDGLADAAALWDEHSAESASAFRHLAAGG